MKTLILLLWIFHAVDNLEASNQNLSNVFTWEDLMNQVQSTFSSATKYFLPSLMRSVSESNISGACERSLMAYGMSLRKMKSWAVRMLDASGKIPGGVLEGTLVDFGSLDECLKIKVFASGSNLKQELFRGRYCMVNLKSSLIKPLTYKSADGRNYTDIYGQVPEFAYEFLSNAGDFLYHFSFWIGTCLPSKCGEDDVKKIVSIFTAPLGIEASLSDCQVEDNFVWPLYSIIAVCVLSFLAVVCTLGSLTDVISRSQKSKVAEMKEDNMLLKILKSFSLLSNTKKLFCESGRQECLSFLDGVRFLTAAWIALLHAYFYPNTWEFLKYSNLYGMTSDYANAKMPIISNFSIAVDSFFFMSGFLLFHTTWKTLEINKGSLNIFMFFLHKYWKMTPPIVLAIILLFAMPLIDSGPIWNSTLNPEIQKCQDFWWRNMFYVSNLWDEHCLTHVWYLGALMQLHIAGTFILLVAYRWPRFGIFISLIMLAGCITGTATIIILNDYPVLAMTKGENLQYFEEITRRIYIKPFLHFPTYLIGMVTAWLISKLQSRKLAQKYQILGWTFAAAVSLPSVFAIHAPAEHVATRAFQTIGGRIGLVLGISWVTYACATGIGGYVNRFLSWKAFSPLSQLSYLLYLLHPLVLLYWTASTRERLFFSQSGQVFRYLSTTVVGAFLAYAGHVTVELPFLKLEKLIFKNRSDLNTKNSQEKNSSMIEVVKIQNV